MKTIEDIFTELCLEKGYSSFPSFVENELSIEAYEMACEAAKLYAEQAIDIFVGSATLDRAYPDGDYEARYELPYVESSGATLVISEDSVTKAKQGIR